MRRTDIGAVTLLAVVLLAATSCADRSDNAGKSAAPRPAAVDQSGCPSGPRFELSLAIDTGGQATPLAAVIHFAEHGGVAGYNVPAREWFRVASPFGGEENEGGVTMAAGRLFVHVVHLTDGTWTVDSGGRCTSAG